jgi:WS/DGAT/MGAT family acyltransferase
MERMSPQDAFYLRVEDEANHMHSASVAVFAGPAPGYDETVEMVKSKLHLVPRYRRRIRFVPLELGRPVWVDDPHFNIEYHVRHTSLPRPGSDDQLCNLVGRVMSQQLDRAKPLWELWITEGLGEGQWAILSKIHHALGDGVPGTDLLSMIVEESPSPRGSKPETWKPEAQPSNAQLLGDAVLERVLSPYEQLRTLRWCADLAASRGSSASLVGACSTSRASNPRPLSPARSGPTGAGAGRPRPWRT